MSFELDNTIKRTLEFHDEHPFDPVHDKRHHQRIVDNAKEIVKKEKLQSQIDIKLLLVASAIHDAIDEKRKDTQSQLKIVKNYLNNLFEFEFTDKVIECISDHSFGKSQKSVEQQVLYDADKLDYSSRVRFDEAMEAVELGKMQLDKLKYYFGLWKERVDDVPKSLHFKSSKKEFKRRTKDVL